MTQIEAAAGPKVAQTVVFARRGKKKPQISQMTQIEEGAQWVSGQYLNTDPLTH